MVRETRHLWVGNLPENIREERIRDHFKRYGRVQSVKLVPGGAGSQCATVAFMDIKSAAKAHNAEHTLDEHLLSTEYYEPSAYTPGAPASTPPSTPNNLSTHTPRFPLSASSEDHPAFDRTSHFYERGNSTPVPVSGGSPLNSGGRGEVDFLRRPAGYPGPPDPLRGRPRERVFRNGPTFSPGTERASTGQRRNWQLELPRYPTESGDSAGSVVKRKQSGSESRSGSQSSRSRSPARSPTHSSSPSARSSGSSERSTSPAAVADNKTRLLPQTTLTPPTSTVSTVSSGTAVTSAPTLSVYSDDRRPLAICVRNLPTRSSDTSLKDGLYHEYKKHGKVTSVKIVGAANDRYALVCFKKPEDVVKAIEVSRDKSFFGCIIDVSPYHGYDMEDNEARPYDTELDEYHPKASRTLFIGSLEKDITTQAIRQTFEKFGEILEIDVKKQSASSSSSSSYAFCQFADIASVVKAMRTLDGEPMGETRLKLGFGKSLSSSCVWITGFGEQVGDKYLELQFRKFGSLSQVVVDRARGQALIFFDQVPSAAEAVKQMRNASLRGRRVQIDYASRECQDAFFEKLTLREDTWTATEDAVRARYVAPRVRSSSYSRSSGGRTPRRHEVFSESPLYRSFDELSSDGDELPPGEQTELNHLHKRRDQLKEKLRREKTKATRSVMAADQGLVVTTHNHRRRLSSHRRSSGEGPAVVGKRRKTGSTSEDERRRQYHQSGDESRPGTPLFDELPDQRPKEPRKAPSTIKRPEEPLSLPLPSFASEYFPNVRTSAASVPSPPPSATSPPAISPARPATPNSSSSSEISPQSPNLEERIRSLSEKYEVWETRTKPPIVRPRPQVMHVDVRELPPSDIVKSVLSRPSVFDEDSKRLENVNEKYEPRDFATYQRPPELELLMSKFETSDPRAGSYNNPVSVRVSPLASPSTAVLSPAAKGLQYPFPTHPPHASIGQTAAGPLSHMRHMSKTVEFSVAKAESWLGINRNSEPNTSGFSHRFLAASSFRQKPPDLQNTHLKTDGKPSDPRLDKASAAGPLTPLTPVSPLILCNPSTPMTSAFPQRVVHRLCDGERAKTERPVLKATDLLIRSTTELKPPLITAREIRADRKSSTDSEPPKPVAVAVPVPVPVPVPLTVQPKPVLVEKCSDSVSLDKTFSAQETETKTKPSDLIDNCSASVKDLDNPKLELAVNQCESTKKLDSSSIKFNHSQPKTPNPSSSPVELKTPLVVGPETRLSAAVENIKSPPVSVVREHGCSKTLMIKPDNGLIAHAQSRDPVPPKTVTEYVPFNIRDKESGSLNHRDKSRDDKLKPIEKDKHKLHEKERERFKSISRDKTKEREISEIVDKERKKERDVEINRKKDRESMEITERDKRKNSCETKEEDVENAKKDHHNLLDTLDRRKLCNDKKLEHHEPRKSVDTAIEKLKRKDGEKRKDERRKEHSSSDKHRKSSDDRKKDEKLNGPCIPVPATIGSKRRISSADSAESEDAKRAKLDSKRRDSRDSRSSGSSSKRSDTKEGKTGEQKKSFDEQGKKKEEERKKHDEKKKEFAKKLKIKDELRSVREYNGKGVKDNHDPKHSSDSDDEKRSNSHRKDKEKKRPFGSSESLEDRKAVKKQDDRMQIRRENGITESCTDSDSEPKKHSIFDVVLDEPAYISMYDKVKARSTKNLQKQQEEEKRQGKLKEKFSALKQSRAKREEKKRSTSWDEDSDSDNSTRPRPRRFSRLSSDDDEPMLKDSSDEPVRDRPRSGRLRAAEIYSEDDSENSMDKSKVFIKINDDEKKPHLSKVLTNHTNQTATAKPDNKMNKVRLSLDSSSERLANDIRMKKRSSHDGLSESDSYPSLNKITDKTERKKSKKKDKRKWSDDEKLVDDDDDERKKLEKRERRKSIQIGCDDHDENKPKRRLPMLSAAIETFNITNRERDDKRMEEMFGSCEDSDQSQQKTDKSIPSKWHVDEIYNSDDSDMNAVMEARKAKEKRKKDRKPREPCKEVGQEIRVAYNRHDNDEVKSDAELKMRMNKEKKKKRKKSKDEKSSRHHHHHYHQEKEKLPDSQHSMPSLIEAKSPSTSPSPPTPTVAQKKPKEKLPVFTQHETAVQSISQPDAVKNSKSLPVLAGDDRENGTKERAVISQEETEDAVAALLGETFSYGSCYSGSPPAEPEPAPHDEEEMRQAVQSLNSDTKPGTPQSDNDLQIDTDAEESEEFSGNRFDYIPRTPDVDFGPPKTPDIVPIKNTVRKDTVRNSRDSLETPITDNALPPTHDAQRKPTLLQTSPKQPFKEQPPVESPVRRIPESRVLLAPPPLVPVSKPVPPPLPSAAAPSNIALVRPINLPPNAATALVFARGAAPGHSPRKAFAITQPGNLIPARVSIQPPVLSPVTPSAITSPRLPLPSTRLVNPTTIVSPRQLSQPTLVVTSPGLSVVQNRPLLSPPDKARIQHLPPLASPPRPISHHTTPVIAHAPLERQPLLIARQVPVVAQSIPSSVPICHPPPIVNHSVQSIIQAQPVLSTITVPTLQIAQKSVVTKTPETSTVLTSTGNVEPKNVGVSVICQKQPCEKPVLFDEAKDDKKPLFKDMLELKDENRSKATHGGTLDLTVKTDHEDKPVVSKAEPVCQNHVESVIKRVEHHDKSPVLIDIKIEPDNHDYVAPVEKAAVLVEKSVVAADKTPPPVEKKIELNDSKDSSDDDKPINSFAKKTRKRAGRGGPGSRRGGRAATKVENDNSAPTVSRRGRGRGMRGGHNIGRKQAADVYEFHDESEDEAMVEETRTVMNMKSPTHNKDLPTTPSKTASGKEITRQVKNPLVTKPIEAIPEKSIANNTASNNTRKSKRLLEKDGSRTNIDEVIDDVIKNVNLRTSPRRALRQTAGGKQQLSMAPPPPKKGRLRKAMLDDEWKLYETLKSPEPEDLPMGDVKETPMNVQENSEASDEEPTTLIDPVTGMLMAMRAKEGGKYVPVPGGTQPGVATTVISSIAPPTPPPPAPAPVIAGPAITATNVIAKSPQLMKTEMLPNVSEGLASHWLGQVQSAKPIPKSAPVEKPSMVFMSCRPPTPPTTPHAGHSPVPMQATPNPPHVKMVECVVRPPSRQENKPKSLDQCHSLPLASPDSNPPKILMLPDEYLSANPALLSPVSNKVILSQKPMYVGPHLAMSKEPLPAKPVFVPAANLRGMPPTPKALPDVLPQKSIYVTSKCLTPGVGMKIGVASSPPAHDLLPIAGAVASPPPRGPNFVSPQPIVAGASSSRTIENVPRVPCASPRSFPPFDSAIPGHGVQSPPPAHQQGDAVNLGHLPPYVSFSYPSYGILSTYPRLMDENGEIRHSPPLELRRGGEPVYISPHVGRYFNEPPPAHLHQRIALSQPAAAAEAPCQLAPRISISTPPHASPVPETTLYSSLQVVPHTSDPVHHSCNSSNRSQSYPIMWQGLLALKNDQSAVQMHFVRGSEEIAKNCLRCNADGSTSPLRIAQRMRLEQNQLEGVQRKLQHVNEHCILLALPCGRDQADVLQQSSNLSNAFISYLQQKQAAGIVNVANPPSDMMPAYVVHIFPSCEFATNTLARAAPNLLQCMSDIPHLIIIIATV